MNYNFAETRITLYTHGDFNRIKNRKDVKIIIYVIIMIFIIALLFSIKDVKINKYSNTTLQKKTAGLYSILNGENWVGKLPDIVEGNLEYEVEPSQSINAEFVTLKLKQNLGDGLFIQYSTDAETWNEYTNGIKIFDNTTIYYRVRNAAHDESKYVAVATVSNIDRDKPTITNIETTGSTATITAEDIIESSNNGVQYYGYSEVEGEIPTNWLSNNTITNLLEGKDYYFYVKDKAQNISEGLLAKTKINTYSLAYNLNSGTLSTNNPSTYTVKDLPITFNKPTRSNYTFLGWKENSETIPKVNATLSGYTTGNKNYTAYWGKSGGVIQNKNSVDVFGEMANISKLAEYGISIKYPSYIDDKYEELYNLGMGTWRNVHNQTYTVNIDYQKLDKKLYNAQFSGISTDFLLQPDGVSGKTSKVEAYIVCNYTDGTKTETQKVTETSVVGVRQVNRSTYLLFNTSKNVKSLSINIILNDPDYGGAYGWIKKLNLLI